MKRDIKKSEKKFFNYFQAFGASASAGAACSGCLDDGHDDLPWQQPSFWLSGLAGQAHLPSGWSAAAVAAGLVSSTAGLAAGTCSVDDMMMTNWR